MLEFTVQNLSRGPRRWRLPLSHGPHVYIKFKQRVTRLGGGVQSLNHVWLFVTPWTAAHQASLSFPISQGLLRLMSVASVMPSTILFSVVPFSSCPQSFPASRCFPTDCNLVLRNFILLRKTLTLKNCIIHHACCAVHLTISSLFYNQLYLHTIRFKYMRGIN